MKQHVGLLLARVVVGARAISACRRRALSVRERALLQHVFAHSLDLSRIEIREELRGLINISGRAFVIENTIHLPLPQNQVPNALLVHEATHVWQFQNGGHAYIADSLWAQTFGDGYQLEKGLAQGKGWAELNCEQQATLIEMAWAQGCFGGAPFVVRGRDWTPAFREAVTELRAGRGATMRGAKSR